MDAALASEIMQALRVIVAQPMQTILCITDGVECHAGEKAKYKKVPGLWAKLLNRI